MSAYINNNNTEAINQKRTMFGVDLSDPHALAKFFLTQLTLRSGINCLQGQSPIPKEADPSLVEEVISILNDALNYCKNISDDVINTLTSSYDSTIEIVGRELGCSQFFLNENHIFYESQIKQPVPIGSMLRAIDKVKSNNTIPENSFSKFLDSINPQKPIDTQEENKSFCISR